ncbi:MAG: glycosyltransferase family 9 protein [Candidatus Desantisbacteria bacterium]
MKLIDYYIGLPLCWIINLYDYLFNPGNSNRLPDKSRVKRILIIKCWGMGSIALALPMVKMIKEYYPDACLEFLTFSRNKELLEISKLVDSIIEFQIDKKRQIIPVLFRLILYLQRQRFDISFNLEFLANFSLLLAYISRIPIRVGFKHFGLNKDRLLTHEVVFREYQHIKQNFLNLLKPLEIPLTNPCSMNLTPSLMSIDNVDNFITDVFESNNSPLICVNVNAGELAVERRWPKENFVLLIKELLNKYPFRIVLIGAVQDVNYVNEVLRLLPQTVLNLAGKLNIEELIALLSRCSLLISNDSGPLHLASLVNIPTVSFFGPETPSLYGPIGNKNKVFFNEVPCSPCIRVRDMKRIRCDKGLICLRSISTQEVSEYILEQFLSNKATAQ